MKTAFVASDNELSAEIRQGLWCSTNCCTQCSTTVHWAVLSCTKGCAPAGSVIYLSRIQAAMRGRAGKQVIALKPATEPTAANQVIKTTTTRISSIDPSEDRSTPELWPYLESLNAKNGEWDRHLIYIYRVEPGPSVPVEKCVRYISTADGSQVSLSDQEAVEFALMQKYGGKVFRLIVKRGSERVTQGRVYVDAPVRPITVQPDMSGQGTSNGSIQQPMTDASATAQVAGRAMDALTSQERQSAEIGFSAMRTAAEVMQRFATGGGGGDDITKQFLAVAMQRMLAPPPDPMQQMLQFFAVMKEMNNNGSGGSVPGLPADMMQQFMKAMFEKFMNPAPAGAPVSASAELMRQFPQIGSTVVEGLREFRMAREAEARIVASQRGMAQPPAPNPQILPAVPGGTTPPPANGAPSMEFVEQRLVDILRQPVSAAQAADDAMAFLDGLDPSAIKELAKLGETGLVALFQNRPVLKQATSNMPRLVEFIRAFLKMHAEDEAAAAAEAATQVPPKAPLPN